MSQTLTAPASGQTAPKPLKLRARDDEDMKVLSSLLQDALLRVKDATFLPDEKRFVAVVNRFRWETAKEAAPAALSDPDGDAAYEDVDITAFERQHAGLCFERVTDVKRRNWPADPEAFVNLLSVAGTQDTTILTFADGVAVKLSHRRRSAHLQDIGDAWPTVWQPDHSAESESA